MTRRYWTFTPPSPLTAEELFVARFAGSIPFEVRIEPRPVQAPSAASLGYATMGPSPDVHDEILSGLETIPGLRKSDTCCQ